MAANHTDSKTLIPRNGCSASASLPSSETLESEGRRAFARCVRVYDERDELFVLTRPYHLRLVYFSMSASREANRATFVQFRLEEDQDHVWIHALHVAPDSRRQGLGGEMVAAIEQIARAVGRSTVLVYPLRKATPFWISRGFTPHPTTSGVMQKRLLLRSAGTR